jgi:hypothetical protein
MATFNNLLEQIKSPRCRAVVGVLQSAKSKSINRWKDLVNSLLNSFSINQSFFFLIRMLE